MDKGTASLKRAIGNQDEAEAIEREIDGIRQNLDDLVNELDHRRHQLNPVVLIRHHPVVLAAAGVVLLGALASSVTLFRARQRKARKTYNFLAGRGRRLGVALGRLTRDSEAAVPASPSVGRRVLAAGVSAAAAVVARRMVQRLIRRTP
jgi:hypothetical protein